MANVFIVSEASILEGNESYTPRGGGDKATHYELDEGVIVSLRKVTPNLVTEYDALRRLTAEERAEHVAAGKKVRENDDRSSQDVLIERCRLVTSGAAESFDWGGASMPVLWRIIEDFLHLSGPIQKPRSES